MNRAFKVDYSFASLVELSDEDRQRLVHQAIERADEMDVGEDEIGLLTWTLAGERSISRAPRKP